MVTCMQGGLKTAKVQILKNMTGALRPGTTTLLLGPPGSGKSVFMQTLSGRLQSDAKVKVQHAVLRRIFECLFRCLLVWLLLPVCLALLGTKLIFQLPAQ